jgi:Cu-Zn family superoxide dismutase
MSAGVHFNPADRPHGHLGQAERYAGDMRGLTADASGAARLDWTSTLLSVGSGVANVSGAVIVHLDRAHCATQPTGNLDPRLACGMVTAC